MSLLMEALRQAEQSKKQGAGARRDSALSLERADGLHPVGAPGQEDREIGLEEAVIGAASTASGDAAQAPVVLAVETAEVISAVSVDHPVPLPETEQASAPSRSKPGAPGEADGVQSVRRPSETPVGSASGCSPASSVGDARQTARAVFLAKREHQRQSRNRRLAVLGIISVLALSGVAGFFFHAQRSLLDNQPSFVAVGPEVASLPESGQESQPAVAPDGAPGVLSPTGGGGHVAVETGQEIIAVLPEPVAHPSASMDSGQEPPVTVATASSLSSAPGEKKETVSRVPENPGVSAGQKGSGRAGADPAVSREKNGGIFPSLPSDTALEPVKPPPAPVVIRRRTAPPPVSPLIATAYDAYQRGDLSGARALYQEALQVEPNNRGALLGMAAIAAQGQEVALARELYLRLLDRDPADPLARAGLLAITTAGDPILQESELKLLLEQSPRSAPLLFTLGNLYAAGQRWSEAQQIYFDALAAARDYTAASSPSSLSGKTSPVRVHPDYAFNLAVSLEHLGKVKQAIHYYREALQATEVQSAGFDPNVLRARLQTLESGLTP